MSFKKAMQLLVPLLLCTAMLTGCAFPFAIKAKSPILSGYTAKEEHFDPDGFQDYVDYCKYVYKPEFDGFDRDRRYLPADGIDVDYLKGYFENFSQWMESERRLAEYDFDIACINEGDPFIIESKPYYNEFDGTTDDYADYTVYLFDRETATLYYIHANI